MNTGKSGETDGRYSDICGASNRDGEPCKLPAGWGTPGSGGDRCKFHGGCSAGPNDTSHLEGNDFAENNPGGGAPKANGNAEIHGGFSDWKVAYERFDGETKAFVKHLITEMRATAKEHAPELDSERRERLLKEKATLSMLYRKASMDLFETRESGPTRGFMTEREVEIDGETYRVERVNPANDALQRIRRREEEIARELCLWPGYQ